MCCWPLPLTVTLTVLVLPSTVSVTVQTEPAGMSEYVCEWLPVAPAAMSKLGVRAAPLQLVTMVTGPCLPAAVPAMVFVTTSDPGASKSAVASTMVVSVPDWDRMSFCASEAPPSYRYTLPAGTAATAVASICADDAPVDLSHMCWPSGTTAP